MRGRVMVTYLVLVLICVGVFAFRYGWVMQDSRVIDFHRTEQLHASLLAAALAPAVADYVLSETSLADLNQLVDQLGASVDGRMTVLDARGDVIRDTRFAADWIDNQWQQIEVQTALAHQGEYDIRVDPLSGDERLYVAAPMQLDGQVLGVLQLSVPTERMGAAVRQAWLSLGVTALVAAVAALAAGLALASAVVSPVQQLRRSAMSVAAGNLDPDLTIAGSGDMADVVRAFEVMTARMRNLVQQQKDFVANASHQLRTPLTTIRLRVEALAGGARHDEAVASRFLSDIESEIDRLSHLVDELLLLSRVEAGIEALKMDRLNLSLVLSQAVAAFYPRAEAAGVAVTLDAPADLVPARASTAHIRQVLDNLLDNALKHTPSGGLVTVSCRRTDGMLAVVVTDTGHGISDQDLPRVFDRFYRGRSKGRVAGTGLGLAIVRSIVEAHGGEVKVESREGKGTSVRFTLPPDVRPATVRSDA